LSQFGWTGLTVFKVLDTLVVVAICCVIAFHAPKTARRVATMGIDGRRAITA
jgi:hypothetical protein